jgi:mannonate dehydratase
MHMHRRDIFKLSAAAAPGSLAQAAPAQKTTGKKVLMKLGTQNGHSDENLRVCAAFGVNNICSGLPSNKIDNNWSAESLTKLREKVEGFGLKLDMIPLPLSSAYITRAELPSIMLGKSPDRDRDIDTVCEIIRSAAKAGIPAVKYNMSILGVVRTAPTKGRGGATYSTFHYDEAKQEPPLTEAGRVTPEIYWDRITYFLKRVVPVAEEFKTKIACHPHDPGMPADKGYRGVNTVLGSVDGLKKFLSIMPSKYHGLNFCQGTVSEMLKDPNKEIVDVIKYFGSRGKIFNVHFRNIQGGFLNFSETFPDNGDVNFINCIRAYKEVGYDGMLMPDHVPRIEGDTGGRQAFAYCYGYIQALLQLVKMEG